MSTAKAKLHTIMTRKGQKCRYETWQLPQSEAGSIAVEGNLEMGLLEFGKEDPMFACKLHLPDGVMIQSSNFRRKKDAEQDAALHALQKMGIAYEPGALQATTKELWEGLLRKVSLAFTDQMVLAYKPLAEHFRAAVQRKGSRFGQVSAIVLTVLDAKITSQCKSVDQLADNNPAHAAALVRKAAAACPSLRLSGDGLWIGRCDPFSPELVTMLLTDWEDRIKSAPLEKSGDVESLKVTRPLTVPVLNRASAFEAVYIPACPDKELSTISLTAASDVYYLDTIAHELGLQDTGNVFMSRQIGKAPDGSRLFWGMWERPPRVNIPEVDLVEQVEPLKHYPDLCSKDGPMEALRNPGGLPLKNERASFLVGHAINGDAILATVGSTWGSDGRCIYDDFTLSCFHRLMLGRTPWGAYKLSRRSLLVSDLPKLYTCRAHWQGASPKSLLSDFCHQHRLPEAEYTFNDSNESSNNSADADPVEGGGHSRDLMFMNDSASGQHHSPGSRQGPFQCRVRVGSAGNEAHIHFQSDGYFRSRNDAIQSAALNALVSYGRWSGTGCLCSYFQNQDFCRSSAGSMDTASRDSTLLKSDESNGQSEFKIIAEEDILGDRPPPGSMVCVSYTVNLIKGRCNCNGSSSPCTTSHHALEAQSDFKFELGVGAVIGQFDACVSQASVGQTLQFCIAAETLGVLYSASSNLGGNGQGWVLEYTVKLLKFEEAMEERIESSHFSPPLSKQRIEYARIMINALQAKTLVDLGCGSGSLLEALLKESNTLEHMIGIDISRKALIRGAKVLQTLSATLTKQNAAHSIQSITLYEGSISDMDPGLRSPDLATCIEVVEHMDPEPLHKLGDSVLGKLAPKVWLVSTPNIEYNPIIRGLEWDPESNSLSQGSKQISSELVESKKTLDAETPNLRNHDHRFEWTRAEFREWASHLASQYGYQVSFAGVGGDGEDDDYSPGFATQIAVFVHNRVAFPPFSQPGGCSQYGYSTSVLTATDLDETKKQLENREAVIPPLKELWQWTSPAQSAAIL